MRARRAAIVQPTLQICERHIAPVDVNESEGAAQAAKHHEHRDQPECLAQISQQFFSAGKHDLSRQTESTWKQQPEGGAVPPNRSTSHYYPLLGYLNSGADFNWSAVVSIVAVHFLAA